MDNQHKFVKPTDIPNKISSDFYIEHMPVLKSNTHSHRSPASEFCMTRCSTIYNSSSGDTKECSLELNRSIKISSEYALPLLTSSPSMILNCSKLKKEEYRRKYQLSTIKKKNNNSIEQVKHRKCHYDSSNSLYMTPFKLSQRKYVKNVVNSRKIFHTVLSIFSQLTLLKIKTTDRNMHKNNSSSNKLAARRRFHLLPNLGTTSFFTLLTLVCLETVLLSTVSTCAKTFYMHWNTSNSIFRIDNTDHIIDVNKGNLAFEFDQVHIICPVYEPGTYENETEKYIIYNVSKVEYETCRITNADPRVIAICDKPQKLMFFTITFRPFTPQPGGLEFLPGNDYYFISTSSKDDLYRRIGGRCSTNNMKVVFKVCCASEENNKTSTSFNHNPGLSGFNHSDHGNTLAGKIDVDLNSPTHINQPNVNNINNVHAGVGNIGNIPFKTINGPTATAINTNIDHFNRIPMQPNGVNVISNNNGVASLGNSGILLSPNHGTINMIPSSGNGVIPYQGQIGQTGIRINNIPPNHHPSIKTSNNNNDEHYDKHPNEVVKNEELTYSSSGSTIHRQILILTYFNDFIKMKNVFIKKLAALNIEKKHLIYKHFSNNVFIPYQQCFFNALFSHIDNIISHFHLMLLSILFAFISQYLYKFNIRSIILNNYKKKLLSKSTMNINTSARKSKISSYFKLKIFSKFCNTVRGNEITTFR